MKPRVTGFGLKALEYTTFGLKALEYETFRLKAPEHETFWLKAREYETFRLKVLEYEAFVSSGPWSLQAQKVVYSLTKASLRSHLGQRVRDFSTEVT